MVKKFENIGLSDLDLISREVLDILSPNHIIILKGDLGVGKTTLTQRIMKNLGVKEDVSSPTFAIVNEYQGPIYHFDLYRIKDAEELEEIGFFEYLDSENMCLIEWPEIAEPYIDLPYVEINLSINEDNSRNVLILSYGE